MQSGASIKPQLLTGKILVVTEADDSLISEDTRFKDLISKSADFLVKHDPIKIFVSTFNESLSVMFDCI